jgi:esterase/lipase superfamily enzyme
MERTYDKWRSPSLGREMEMLVFGTSGTPVLVFPSEQGRFYEWEDQGMLEALSEQLDNGYNQLFCVDTVNDESFLNDEVDPATRIMRYEQYESYIIDEVLPYIHKKNGHFFLISAGIGLGAYHASNMLFKHPNKFNKMIGLSGDYDIRQFMDGHYDDHVYFNNPIDYLSNLSDHEIIRSIQQADIRLAAERDTDDQSTRKLSQTLHRKAIAHVMDIPEQHSDGEWSFWQKMIRKHIV